MLDLAVRQLVKRVLELCASTAVLLHGGNGYTKSGQGEVAESKSLPSWALISRTDLLQEFSVKSPVLGSLVEARMSCWIWL